MAKWLDKYAMGGSLPGATGMMYARTQNPAPSNGKYAKKTLASAQKGKAITKREDFEPWWNWASVQAAGGERRQQTYGNLGDLYAYYAGQPLKHNVLEHSQYKPTDAKNPKADYISINDSKFKQEVIDNYNRVFNEKKLLRDEKQLNNNTYAVSGYTRPRKEQIKKSKSGELYYEKGKDHVSNAIGHYYLSKGKDEKGDYVSYYDVFDEGTGGSNGGGVGETLGLTKPFELYDRIYLDPKTGKPKMQNGGVIKDDLGQWAYPGEITEIGSNDITMQGVDYPVLGVSDTGDTQMMYPDQDYKFNGEKVTEFPMARDGGWLDKYQTGGTLMKDKKVGEAVTPINKLDLRPTYLYFDKQTEDVYDPNCPDGVGCSKQATDYAQKITGLPREKYAPADAAYRDAVAKRTGLINLFDQEGDQKTNANSNIEGWKYPKANDFSNWKAGDIVTLDAGRDVYFGYKAPKGYMRSDNSGATHNGVIVGFMENGRPIIKHGYATEKNKGKSVTEILGDDGRVSSLGHGKYAIKSVWRPKEVDASGQINSIKNVIDTAEERAQRKQTTTSNSSFYLKPTKEEKLQKDYPVGAEFSGANTRLQTKNKLVNLFNDEKLDKDLQYKLGITSQELDKLKPVVYGVFGQESNFNDVDNAGASFKELIGNLFGNNSRGAAQIKMSSLTADEKKVLGIKKASDLDKDEVAYKAALLMLNNSRKRMNQEVEQGTHPELADKDEYFRAGYYYNSPARAIQSSEKFTKKKDKKATISDIKKNELRMDEGSYPYKLMERAKDLGVNVDFDATAELEPVVVRSMVKNNKGTKFVPKQETGGWLNKYK
jgi:hypothetical protein